MDVHKVALISASLGGFDRINTHTVQTIPLDEHIFTDKNFPPRPNALHPRLHAKVPKMFGWQLVPNYTHYLWLDGNIQLHCACAAKDLLEELGKDDIVVFRHPNRPNIRQENRYTRKGINQQSHYMVDRYEGECLKEAVAEIEEDKDYIDDLLVCGGVFLYRDCPEVRGMFKEWWYFNSRYIVQDQISFPYVLKKSGIKLKVLDINPYEWDNIKIHRHV